MQDSMAVGQSPFQLGGVGTATSGVPITPPSPSLPSVVSAITRAHDHAQALYSQTAKASASLATIRSGLATLAGKGDLVSGEDVVNEAGKMVASGTHSPMEMATLLSDMPQGGPALASWVQGHLAKLAQNEQTVAPLHSVARHELGASGLRALAAHSVIPNLSQETSGNA